MYRLNFFRRSTTAIFPKHLIKTLIFSHIDYCSVAMSKMSNKPEERLQRLINRGIRYIFELRRTERITAYIRKLAWPTVASWRAFMTASITFRVLKNGEPKYLPAFFKPNTTNQPERFARGTLEVPHFRKEPIRKSFHVSGVYIWNFIQINIRNLQARLTFKCKLCQHLFHQTQGVPKSYMCFENHSNCYMDFSSLYFYSLS